MGRMDGRTRDAALRLYNGFTIHKRSFQALCDRGLAEAHNHTEQRLTEAGRHFIATGVILPC
jgi:hypothetical protein